MTISEKNQNFMQRYHAVLMPLLLALLSYAGVDQYGAYQERQAAAAPTEVTVNVESMPESTDNVRSDAEIQAIVNAALARQAKEHRCNYHGNCQ